MAAFMDACPRCGVCPVGGVGPRTTFRDIGVQTDGPDEPSSDALRMRVYCKLRKEKEEREMHAHLALKRAQ
eukprot:795634-Pleurochrysis_carterae.AAC.2